MTVPDAGAAMGAGAATGAGCRGRSEVAGRHATADPGAGLAWRVRVRAAGAGREAGTCGEGRRYVALDDAPVRAGTDPSRLYGDAGGVGRSLGPR